MNFDCGLTYAVPDFDPRELPDRLRGAVQSYRDEADHLRRLPDLLVEELRRSGVFRLFSPAELGGFEVPVATALDILEAFGRMDGSTAWVVWNGNIGVSAAILPPAGSARVWATSPDQIIANNATPSGVASRVPGGFLLSGSWSVVTGADFADWITLFAVVGGNAHDVRLFAVPRQDVTVTDTWDVSGMRGTGSHRVTVDELFVPAELSGRLDKPPVIDRPLYRVPAFSIVAPGGAAVVLGMARAAIDEMLRIATVRTGHDGLALGQNSALQAAIGRADADLRAARLLLLDAAADLDRGAAAAMSITDRQRGALRAAMSHANVVARNVFVSMHELGGSASLHRSSPLEQIVRDGLAATQHVNNSAALFELAGQLLLGLEPASPVF
jgi:indole-3-acetate monooxygenase